MKEFCEAIARDFTQLNLCYYFAFLMGVFDYVRVIFGGTKAEFALPSLEALIKWSQAFEHEVVAVYTQPDRPQGRGRKRFSNNIKTLADRYQIPVYQPIHLKSTETQEAMRALRPDLFVVVAYGLLLPSSVLAIPTYACLNVHASLLPSWRGAAPIQRALLSENTHTGITIMQMDVGLDTGPILHQVSEPILHTDTTGSLQFRLALLGATALVTVLSNLQSFLTHAQPQNELKSSYAPKITKAEANIDWSLPAEILCNAIRAFDPWPISFSYLNQKRIRIWKARPCIISNDGTMVPGTVVALSRDGMTVATGRGGLQITHLQLEGGVCLPFHRLWHGALSWLNIGMQFQNAI